MLSIMKRRSRKSCRSSTATLTVRAGSHSLTGPTLGGIIAAGFALTIPTFQPQGRTTSFPPDTGKGEGSLPSPFCCCGFQRRIVAAKTISREATKQFVRGIRLFALGRHGRIRTALGRRSAPVYEPITSLQIFRNCASVSRVCCTRPCHLTRSVMSLTCSSVAFNPCWSR